MKYVLLMVLTVIILAGCMNPAMATNKWPWYVEAEGDWTLQIDAQYQNGFKTHLVPGTGTTGFELSTLIGTDQIYWEATINKDAFVKVVYRGEVVYNGHLSQGDVIALE